MVKRQMGPPPLSHPQPVEIDPGSYNRLSGPYPPWPESGSYLGSIGDPNAIFTNSMSLDKTANMPPDYGPRNGPRDLMNEWLNSGKNGPWIPRGAVPEVPLDERPQARGHPHPWRGSGGGHQSGIQNRSGHPSDTGSVHFGILPSDSGYGSALGLESPSARGSDVVDQSPEMRNLRGPISDYQPYGENASYREPHELFSWHLPSASSTQFRCEHCHQFVKTKSELK
jgi:hypothetical protein